MVIDAQGVLVLSASKADNVSGISVKGTGWTLSLILTSELKGHHQTVSPLRSPSSVHTGSRPTGITKQRRPRLQGWQYIAVRL